MSKNWIYSLNVDHKLMAPVNFYPFLLAGFPQMLTFCLTNTSLVPMTFSLRIPGDGTGPPSITSALQVSQLNRTKWLSEESAGERPTEFSIIPSSGTVRAQGQVDLQVHSITQTVAAEESDNMHCLKSLWK